jgi:hypothetical protein
MNAVPQSVWSLFSSQRQFKIPLYQRHYDWHEEQCEALWDDFLRLCTNEDKEMSHYLGTMVVEELDGAFQVVDGQQRTTSLMLLFRALQDYLGHDKGADLRHLTHIPPSCLSVTATGIAHGEDTCSNSGLRLIPQGEGRLGLDFESFSTVMKDGDQGGHHANKNYQKNLQFFRNSIQNYIKYASNANTLTFDNIKSTLERMLLAFIELNRKGQDADDPQTIFEKMNAEGKDLEVHDLIRNYIFMLAAESTGTGTSQELANAKQQSLYLNEWQNFEHEFPDRAFHQMKDFFRDYLIIKTGDVEISSGRNLYVKFKAYLHGDNANNPIFNGGSLKEFVNVEKLANDIWKYADAWGKVVFGNPIKDISDRAKNLIKHLKDFSRIAHAPYYPFVTMLIVDWEEHHGEQSHHTNLPNILEILNKFIAISRITETYVGFGTKFLGPLVTSKMTCNLDALIKNPLVFQQQLKGLWPEGFDSKKQLENALLGLQLETDIQNEPQEASLELGSISQTQEDKLLDQGTGDDSRPNMPQTDTASTNEALPDVYHANTRMTTYLLLKINEEMTEETGDTIMDYLEPRHSLEHIMPQSYPEPWQFVDFAWYASRLNSLGNLTLVGKAYNSQLSNRPLSDKLRWYKDSSYIITRELVAKLQGAVESESPQRIDLQKFKESINSRARELTTTASVIFQF